MRSARIRYTLLHFFLPLVLLMVASVVEVKGQVYANSQVNSVSGICIGCGVLTPGDAVEQASLTNFSEFVVTVAVVGVSVQQTLIFPAENSNAGCDEIVVKISNTGALIDLNLLGGLFVQIYNGGTTVGAELAINSPLISLLSTGNQAEVRIKPTSKFDRVQLKLKANLLGLLKNFRIHYAYTTTLKPSLASIPAQGICNGQSINLATLNPADNNNISGGTYTWSTTAGGAALPSTTVSPTTTTSYSVRYQKDDCYDDKSVTVTVYPKPHAPPIKPVITNN